MKKAPTVSEVFTYILKYLFSKNLFLFLVFTHKCLLFSNVCFQSFHFGDHFRFIAFSSFLLFPCKQKVQTQRKVIVFSQKCSHVNVANSLSNLVTSKNLPTMHIDHFYLKGKRCGLVLEQSGFWGVQFMSYDSMMNS